MYINVRVSIAAYLYLCVFVLFKFLPLFWRRTPRNFSLFLRFVLCVRMYVCVYVYMYVCVCVVGSKANGGDGEMEGKYFKKKKEKTKQKWKKVKKHKYNDTPPSHLPAPFEFFQLFHPSLFSGSSCCYHCYYLWLTLSLLLLLMLFVFPSLSVPLSLLSLFFFYFRYFWLSAYVFFFRISLK